MLRTAGYPAPEAPSQSPQYSQSVDSRDEVIRLVSIEGRSNRCCEVGRALAVAGRTDLYFDGGFGAILQNCRQILQLPRWKFPSGAIILVFARQNIIGIEHASSETRALTGRAGSTFK
jgi:hypothetical protein